MRTIVLNRNNIVPDGDNNKLVYDFNGSVVFKDSYIAVSQVSMYYSWFNISTRLQNNTFTYIWTVGGTATVYTVLIPDSLVEISNINQYLQYTMIANGHYLINGSGENVYYVELLVNPSRYAVQINTFLVPTTLPAGFTAPAGFAGFPTTARNPVITLPSKINDIFGYVAGYTTSGNVANTYVAPTNQDKIAKTAGGTISYLSTKSPDIQPNSSILVSMSNIDNKYSSLSSLIYSVVPSVAIGGLINDRPSQLVFNKLIEGTYNQLRITLLGTDLNPIVINDPAISILLVIKDKGEN